MATVGSDIIEDVSGVIVAAGITLSADGPAVTDNGQVVALGYSELLVGSDTIMLPASLRYPPHLSLSSTTPSSRYGESSITLEGTPSTAGSSNSSGLQMIPASTGTLPQTNPSIPPTVTASIGYQTGLSRSQAATGTRPITAFTTGTAGKFASLASSFSTASISGVGLPSIITITDAGGSTIIGTPTTITNVPNLSTATLNNPSWTGDTFTTTSTQGGSPTVVPVLLVGGAYIGLFGLGVEVGADASLLSVFALAGLPAFSLLPDGAPQPEPNQEQPEQPSNQPSGNQPSQSQPTGTSWTVTSISSTSLAVTSGCSSCDFCATYDYNPTATPNPMDSDSDDSLMRRALAGRFFVEKRANSKATRAAVVADSQCHVSTYTRKPDYPGPGDVANNEGAGNARFAAFYATATYWAVPTVSFSKDFFGSQSWLEERYRAA